MNASIFSPYTHIYIYTYTYLKLNIQDVCLPGAVCRSKHTALQCFYTGSEHHVLPVFLAAAALPPVGRREVCHTPEEDCGCTAARTIQGWLFHTTGAKRALHCPWPEGSCPGCTKDLKI